MRSYGSVVFFVEVFINFEMVFFLVLVFKQFIVFVIFLFEEEGKFLFDDDVCQYVLEFLDYGMVIMLCQMIGYILGLCSVFQFLGMIGFNLSDMIIEEMVFEMIFCQKELNFVFGECFSYLNFGYVLLVEVVECVVGLLFEEFICRCIFEFFGMNDFFVRIDLGKLVENLVCFYSYNGMLYLYVMVDYFYGGLIGLFIIFDDFVKWVVNFCDLIEEYCVVVCMEEVVFFGDGSVMNYVMGFFVEEWCGQCFVYYVGFDVGYVVFVVCFFEQDFVVVLFVNMMVIDV